MAYELYIRAVGLNHYCRALTGGRHNSEISDTDKHINNRAKDKEERTY